MTVETIILGDTFAFGSGGIAHGVSPEMYGAVGDGITDDSAAIRAAIRDVGAGGGNRVIFRKRYLCNIGAENVTSGGSGKIILPIEYDNIWLDFSGGELLCTLSSEGKNFISFGGTLKPNPAVSEYPTIRDTRNYAGTFNSTTSAFALYGISPASAGAQAVTLTNPADHTDFEVGDWVFIRYGGTLFASEPSNYDCPFAEYNQVVAKNPTTGIVSLLKPLKFAYQAVNYPAGHDSAGQAVPWGVINMTRPNNVLQQGFKITGRGSIRMSGHAGHCVMIGNQARALDLFLDGGMLLESSGNILSFGLTDSNIGPYRATSTASGYDVSIVSNDSGNHDTNWSGVHAIAPQTYVHLNEGTSGNNIRGLRLINTAPTGNCIGFNAFSFNNRVEGIIEGVNANIPAVGLNESTHDNVLDLTGPGGSTFVADAGTNNVVRTNKSALVAIGATTSLDGGFEHVFVSAGQMQAVSPATEAIAGYTHPGIKLPESGDSYLLCGVMLPSSWKEAKMVLHLNNLGASSGNVRIGYEGQVTSDGMNHYGASRFFSSGANVPAPAQDFVSYYELPGRIQLETAGNSFPASTYGLGLKLSRFPTDTADDTFGGDIIVMGIDFRRTA